MKKLAVALLATTVMSTPVAFAASDNYQQQPQGQQTQGQQTQQNDNQQSRMNQHGQNAQDQNAQNQSTNDRQSQNKNQQSAQDQQSQQGNQQSAENNQPISPQNLSRDEIRQVQQALQKDGFHAGRVDGRWGPETQSAVKEFQQSKQMEPTGKLDRQTVADLGLDASQFSQSQNQEQ
jgi:hypothetical protein